MTALEVMQEALQHLADGKEVTGSYRDFARDALTKAAAAKPVQKYEFWSECPFTIGFDFEMRPFLSRTSRGGRP